MEHSTFAENTPGSDSEMPALEESSNNSEMNCESPPALENNFELKFSDSDSELDSDSDSDPEIPALIECPEDNYRFDNSILEIPGLEDFLEHTVNTCRCCLHHISWDNDYYIDNYWYTPYRCYVCPFMGILL